MHRRTLIWAALIVCLLSQTVLAADWVFPQRLGTRYGEGAEYFSSLSDSAKPDRLTPPAPKWYGYVDYPDYQLYWDINSIAAWPRTNPSTVEIVVKLLWNEQGKEKRIAFLNEQSQRPGGYANLGYTTVIYRFSAGAPQMIVLSEIDYSDDNRSLFWTQSADWREIPTGSREETARQIAMNWLKQEGE